MTDKTTYTSRSNGKTFPWKPIVKESVGLGVAEFTSIGAGIGVVAVADQIAPHTIKASTQFVAKHIIEPYLDVIEKGMGALCRLEECQSDKTLSREERSEKIAHAIVLFVPAFLAGYATKVQMRRIMNHLTEVEKMKPNSWWKIWEGMEIGKYTPHEKFVIAWDEGVHIGSLLLLNTGASQYTDHLIRGTRSMLEGFGLSKQKANDLASMGMIWEFPNFLGLLAGVGAIGYQHSTGRAMSHVNKLSQTSALNHLHTI